MNLYNFIRGFVQSFWSWISNGGHQKTEFTNLPRTMYGEMEVLSVNVLVNEYNFNNADSEDSDALQLFSMELKDKISKAILEEISENLTLECVYHPHSQQYEFRAAIAVSKQPLN